MFTDWLLVRRLAHEIAAMRGARVQDVGQTTDGRFGLQLWWHGSVRLLCADPFAPTPLLTIERGELPIANEPGFVRAAGAAVRGTSLVDVRAKWGDRVLRLDFSSRSRFGVANESAIVFEMVPRFGNLVLLKGQTIVAAAKEFSPSQNAVRSLRAGEPYEAPPVNESRAVPKLLLDGYGEDAAALVERSLAQDDQPLYVYRRDGALVQAHVVALPQLSALQLHREPSLLDILAEERNRQLHGAQSDRAGKRRRDYARMLAMRAQALRIQLERIAARQNDGRSRERLRAEGDALYGGLHELPPEERETAKERAAELFGEYKKLGAAQNYVVARRAAIASALGAIEEIEWELERAADERLDEVAEAIDALISRRGSRQKRATVPRKKRLQYATADGSRVLVGRSPVENADLTFRVARPDDLWFHTRGVPGAHVILQRDDKAAPSDADIAAAAAIAAYYSKAKTAPKVTVDYTLRKHVRKRSASAPGLVVYTHPRSLYVRPHVPDTGLQPDEVSGAAPSQRRAKPGVPPGATEDA